MRPTFPSLAAGLLALAGGVAAAQTPGSGVAGSPGVAPGGGNPVQGTGTAGTATTPANGVATPSRPADVTGTSQPANNTSYLPVPKVGGGQAQRGAESISAPTDPLATRNSSSAVPRQAPYSVDQRMLVAHALGMAIEGSNLKAIAETSGGAPGRREPDSPAKLDAAKMLMSQSARGFEDARMLLSQAGGDSPRNDGSVDLRLVEAANDYIATLAAMGRTPEGANAALMSQDDRGAVAAINHAVREFAQAQSFMAIAPMLGSAATPSPALDTLAAHARQMQTSGRQAIEGFLGEASDRGANSGRPAGPDATLRAGQPSVVMLAQRARDVVAAFSPRVSAGRESNATVGGSGSRGGSGLGATSVGGGTDLGVPSPGVGTPSTPTSGTGNEPSRIGTGNATVPVAPPTSTAPRATDNPR